MPELSSVLDQRKAMNSHDGSHTQTHIHSKSFLPCATSVEDFAERLLKDKRDREQSAPPDEEWRRISRMRSASDSISCSGLWEL